MKKLLLFILAISYLNTSCGSDSTSDEITDEMPIENTEDPPEEEINDEDLINLDESSETSALIGNWRYISASDNGENLELDQCEEKEIIQFNEDNTVIVEHLYYNGLDCALDVLDRANYSISDNEITFTYPYDNPESEPNTLTYEINDDTLSLTFVEGNLVFIQTFMKTSDTFYSETIEDSPNEESTNEVETDETSSLIGNWKYTSGTVDGSEIILTPCADSEIVQFNEDNVYTTEDLILEGNECALVQLITATYEISDNQITLTNSNNSVFENFIFEFTINGNTLSLTSIVSGYEIVSFYTKTDDPLFSEL